MRLRWNDFLGLFGVHECVVSTKAYCDNASVLKSRVSGAGELHPRALAEPDMNLSAHTAPIAEPLCTPNCQ